MGDHSVDVTDLTAINKAYRSIRDESSCEESGSLERFAMALFSDKVDEDTAELHDQGAIVRKWYSSLFNDTGLILAYPKAERFSRMRRWMKSSSSTPQALSGNLESAMSTAQKQASTTMKKDSSEDKLNRTVVNQTTASFMSDDMFNDIDKDGLEKWQQTGKQVLAYVTRKASRNEFFALYWPLFYGFKLTSQAFKYALEARDNDKQASEFLRDLQDKELFGAYQQQLQKMIASQVSSTKFSSIQALAVLVGSYLDTNLMRQEKQIATFLSNPMKKVDLDDDWVDIDEQMGHQEDEMNE